MRLVGHLDELGSNAHLVCRCAHTPFEDRADLQLPPDVSNALAGPFVLHHRRAGNDPQRAQL